MDWHAPTPADLELLQRCSIRNELFANNYSAVNSVLYEKKFHSQIATEGGWLFEKYIASGTTRFAFPHRIDGPADDIREAVAAAQKEARSSGETLTFENVTRAEKDILQKLVPSAQVAATPESGDYIYRTEKLAGLEGKKLSRKRNHIHQFQNKHPDWSFASLDETNLGAVLKIEEDWLEESSEQARAEGSFSDLQLEREMIQLAIGHFSVFSRACDMGGGIIFASGRPVAFCIASRLSDRVTDVHFEKCLSDFGRDGGYAVINREFAANVQTEYINREEDLGIEGLRKAKLSYYPEMILEKFSVCIS